jgi:hypothetical protein
MPSTSAEAPHMRFLPVKSLAAILEIGWTNGPIHLEKENHD